MSGEFDGLSWDEEDLLSATLRGYRRMRRRVKHHPEEEWILLRPVRRDGRSFGLDVVVPDPDDTEEDIEFGQAVAPSARLDDDTSERMTRYEVNRVERHRKEDGTDEIPSLRENSDSPCPQKPKKKWACAKDIKALLKDAGRRMTREQVLDGLLAAGKEHSESAVTKALCHMANESYELTNGTDKYGKGYGLAEWQ